MIHTHAFSTFELQLVLYVQLYVISTHRRAMADTALSQGSDPPMIRRKQKWFRYDLVYTVVHVQYGHLVQWMKAEEQEVQ